MTTQPERSDPLSLWTGPEGPGRNAGAFAFPAQSAAPTLDLDTVRRTIDDLLAEARARLARVSAAELETELAAGALLVDTRPVEQRVADGEIPGAIVIDRNVLEWRLDPASEHRIEGANYGRRVILFCDEGFSSSLAAATLRDLGLDATDLIGGYQAWIALHRA
jgi:rhodanese-related sulfurtransferase